MKIRYDWLNIIQDWLYPPTCLLCGAGGPPGRDLCVSCTQALPWIDSACERCGRALPAPADAPCGSCQVEPPAFDTCHAAFRYEEPVRHLIRSIKYGRRYAAGRLLGQLVAQRLGNLVPPPEVILPVPLHRDRHRERGFNQSVEIARHLSRSFRIPLDLHAVIRHRPTLPQVRLQADQRAQNVCGAFSLRQPIPARHVAVFDDVVTTGATVGAIAELLRRQGVERIDVWAVART